MCIGASADGKQLGFNSVHEGSRQVYLSKKDVTVIAGAPAPTLTSAHAPDGDPGTLLRADKAVLEGTGLDGAAVDIIYTGASGQMTKRALESDFESATGERIVLKTSVWDGISVESADMTVKVTTATGTASPDVPYVA